MSNKRSATNDLNHDNWNREEEPEEMGSFKIAPSEELSKRTFKKGKRRLSSGPAVSVSKANSSTPLSGFSGFGSKPDNVKDIATNAFSFLSSSTSKTSPPKMEVGEKNIKKEDISTENEKNEYLSKLRGLNEAVVDWILLHVKKNPTCILSPVFKDYENYLNEIRKDCKGKEESHRTIPSSQLQFDSSFNFSTATPSKLETEKQQASAKTVKETTSSFSVDLKPGDSKLNNYNFFNNPTVANAVESPLSTINSTPQLSSGFKFGTNLQNFQPESNEISESDEPSKNVFTPVLEEGAVFSQRVKLFIKKDGNYIDKGVGTLFIKPAKDKYQAIVRADTSLGNILLNIILNEATPSERVGKNNVNLICNPTPEDCKSAPVSVLLRVKTESMADNLLEQITKYKKKE